MLLFVFLWGYFWIYAWKCLIVYIFAWASCGSLLHHFIIWSLLDDELVSLIYELVAVLLLVVYAISGSVGNEKVWSYPLFWLMVLYTGCRYWCSLAFFKKIIDFKGVCLPEENFSCLAILIWCLVTFHSRYYVCFRSVCHIHYCVTKLLVF